MKKPFGFLFLLTAIFFSCSNLIENTADYTDSSTSKTTVSSQQCSISVNTGYARTAFPSALPSSGIYYASIAYTEDSTTCYIGASDDSEESVEYLSNSGTIASPQFIFTTPTKDISSCYITLYLCSADYDESDDGTPVNACVAAGTSSASFSLEKGQRSVDNSISVSLSATDNTAVTTGSVSLPVSWDNNDLSIDSITLDATDSEGNSVDYFSTETISEDSETEISSTTITTEEAIPADIYTITMTCEESGEEVLISNPVQTITVLAGFTTDTWYENLSAEDTLTLTEAAGITTFYVCGSTTNTLYGDENTITSYTASDENSGLITKPLATISAAVAKCTEEDTEYTIYLDGTFTLSSVITISTSNTINLIGLDSSDSDIINGDSSCQILNIASGSTVSIENLTLENGSATNGGAISNFGTFTIDSCSIINNTATIHGGGIYNAGTCTINSDAVIGKENKANTATTGGGGIYNYTSGTITMNDGTISYNTSASGAGVGNQGIFYMVDGNILYNTATATGGGVYTGTNHESGTFVMSNGSISNNEVSNSDGLGGGVYLESGTFTITDGSISANTSAYYGGGLYILSYGTFTMEEGSIEGNTASSSGGGIYNTSSSCTISGGTISGNTAAVAGGGISNDGTLDISGYTLIYSNSSESSGGAIYNADESTLSEYVTIYSNEALYGGAVDNDATLSVSGHTILATNSASLGGAVYNNSGTLTVSDSVVITANTATTIGSGILLQAGTLEISDSAVVDAESESASAVSLTRDDTSVSFTPAENDIYLSSSSYDIAITGALTPGSNSTIGTTFTKTAIITPLSYATTIQVLEGDYVSSYYGKFSVTANGSTSWYVDSSGYLTETDPSS